MSSDPHRELKREAEAWGASRERARIVAYLLVAAAHLDAPNSMSVTNDIANALREAADGINGGEHHA